MWEGCEWRIGGQSPGIMSLEESSEWSWGPTRMDGYLKFKGASTSQVIGARNEWLWMIMMAKWYSGTMGPKASWHLSYRWGKTPKKPHPGNLSRPGGIEPNQGCSANMTMLFSWMGSFLLVWNNGDFVDIGSHVFFILQERKSSENGAGCAVRQTWMGEITKCNYLGDMTKIVCYRKRT